MQVVRLLLKARTGALGFRKNSAEVTAGLLGSDVGIHSGFYIRHEVRTRLICRYVVNTKFYMQ